MADHTAPKQWQLTTTETINSFEAWRQNLIYRLSINNDFAPFLGTNYSWSKKSTVHPLRGLRNDAAPIPEAQRLTAIQKNVKLELMLNQIANWCPVIARQTIVNGCTSMTDIWQKIRLHYNIQKSGSQFLDLASMKLKSNERAEDLYQRLMAFFTDNMLEAAGSIKHHGEQPTIDEEITPALENTIVLLWLQSVNPGLPALIKQKYGTELRNKTLASIKPEISQALDSLLDELQSAEESKVFRASAPFKRQPTMPPKRSKSCSLCKAAGRPHTSHFLSRCTYLPAEDRRALAKARYVPDYESDAGDEEDIDHEQHSHEKHSHEQHSHEQHSTIRDNVLVTARRVDIVQSPYLNVFYKHHPLRLTIDCGATTSMIRASCATKLRVPISSATQLASQADGNTPLKVLGEIHVKVSRGSSTYDLDALVVDSLDVDVLAGNNFLSRYDIVPRLSTKEIIIANTEVIKYAQTPGVGHSTARRTQAQLIRNKTKTVILPGEYVTVDTPADSNPDTTWALEPRYDTTISQIPKLSWPPPQEVLSIDHTIRIPNATQDPLLLQRGEHIGQIRQVVPTAYNLNSPDTNATCQTPTQVAPFSSKISVDPDEILTQEQRDKFNELHTLYDHVFNPAISRYNGASGNIEAIVNMGKVQPPQRKGRMPLYNRNQMVELQAKFDQLESQGVFAKPDDVHVNVEYLNLSFLVRKPNGGSRLVTSFGEVGQYAKPQPSLMPDVDSTLRDIAKWKYLIISDLSQSFYQIPLAHDSMKYCGVATPFKGIRVYTRSAMGMPGSETCLEELMSRIMGVLIQEGSVAKLADDLYCGGSSPEEALSNWTKVLAALDKNGLRLSPHKTFICPQSATVLGWLWRNGTIRASPHRIAALAAAELPGTVSGLRSFIGSYKSLSRVLPRYSDLLHPLDLTVAGRQSRDKIDWNDNLIADFKNAQAALSSASTITLPTRHDKLWVVTDASQVKLGIGATLYIRRSDQLLLAGHFNAKLKQHQIGWIPCEIEALSIACAISHFAPYIIQSDHHVHILTDSKPCVEAYHKLCRGQFSNSARVSTFLATISRFPVDIAHIAGKANTVADFASRNPLECSNTNCQICKFISDMQTSVVHSLTVNDISKGTSQMPFTNRPSWRASQQDCPDLRRVHSHLTQGTRPSKKMTQIPNVKKYLKSVTVANDGLLVVKLVQPFQPIRDRIVVPTSLLHGLLTAIHIRFNHPSKYQMKQLTTKYFYALSMDNAIETVVGNCHHCSSLVKIPTYMSSQSTSPPENTIASRYAADVMRRARQMILVVRETVSSYTLTLFIESEKQQDLREGMLQLLLGICPMNEEVVTVRVDPAPGFQALRADPQLRQHNIVLDIGNAKNTNKNPIAERAIGELSAELLKLCPDGGAVSPLSLSMATANINSRIRSSGLSAREVYTQRDQITGEQLPIDDHELIVERHNHRRQNHLPSSKSKGHGHTRHDPEVSKGDLVYIFQDGNKTAARDKYLVIDIDDGRCKLRKFTKTQFRSKLYDVPLRDCYRIQTNVIEQSQWSMRNMDNTDSDTESYATDEDQPSITGNDDTSATTDFDVATLPALEEEATHPTALDENVPVHTQEPNRRSTRVHKPPTWQRDGTYIMNN